MRKILLVEDSPELSELIVAELAKDGFEVHPAATAEDGLALAVVENGQVIFTKGHGLAGQGRPVTPQKQFYLGSVSKSFTALAVMHLVKQGKLELDAPVQRYLPWFQVAQGTQASGQITMRHLLDLLPDLIKPLLLLVGLPVFGNIVMNGSESWLDAYDLLPDATLWISALKSQNLAFFLPDRLRDTGW